jgi:hypothetical protein
MRPSLDAGAAGFGIGSAIYRASDSAERVAAKAAALIAGLPLIVAGSGDGDWPPACAGH